MFCLNMIPTYSWILPAKNEAESLPKLISEIATTMAGKPFEIIVIDDASNDNTKDALEQLRAQFPQLHPLFLLTHQGKWAALVAGIRASRSPIIITLDADLQDDPQEAMKLVAYLSQGYDLVSGWRRERCDALYKTTISKLGNLLVSTVTGYNFHDVNAPMKVYRRQLLDAIPMHGSLLRFSLLFAKKLDFCTKEIPIRHRPRVYGRSKFGILKYLRILYDLILVLLLFSGSGRLTRRQPL